MITEAESLQILPLAIIKAELRIPAFTLPADPTAAATAAAAEARTRRSSNRADRSGAWNFISGG